MVELQLKHTEFSKLDAITLSRWSNGVTTPSYLKQLLIAHTTNTVKEFLDCKQSMVLPVACRRNYEQFVAQFDSKYHSIHLSGTQSVKTIVSERFSTIGADSLIAKRINSLNRRYLMNDKVAHLSLSPTEVMRVSVDDGLAESFLTTYSPQSQVGEYLSKSYRGSQKVLCAGFTYFRSSEDYSSLCGALINKLLSRKIESEYIFFFVRGAKSMAWFEYIGAKQYDVLSSSLEFGNLYLYGMSLKHFTGNPMYLNLASRNNE
ncbi:conserved hypothetical protein [Vibrio crassostreae]|uniref:GNAT family N-acetyltransferase n=1 Tax=Vibrio crassostreae TaxID=246167 RepID=A0ABM9QTY0_9VIBR|nr:conserved hypothetical protein [Vibrio crassostreae]CDT49475.1 conserved hypothetical protein [Vibrio crassostreae]